MEEDTERIQLPLAKLYDATLIGDVPLLQNLLEADPLILDRWIIEKSGTSMQSPLHIAANLGHLEFTRVILRQKPELAEEYEQSKKWSPLHVASAKGHLEISKMLLAVSPDMCLAHDHEGRNPLHIAAIKGEIQVLAELLKAKPEAARNRTSDGETALHLCVSHNQLEALMYMVNETEDGELLNSKDKDDNTVLHLLVAARQTETIKFLLETKLMDKDIINSNGLTAKDALCLCKNDMNKKEILKSLKHVKSLKEKNTLQSNSIWSGEQRNALMVVAILISTMAFQAVVNPPGGVWQDNETEHMPGDGKSIMAYDIKHVAGESVMGHMALSHYKVMLAVNTVGLISSLSVIMLLISGFDYRKRFVGVLMVIMWISITATVVTYLWIVVYLSPYDSIYSDTYVFTIFLSVFFWMLLLVVICFGHVLRIKYFLRYKRLARFSCFTILATFFILVTIELY